jgi:hypothetical protein
MLFSMRTLIGACSCAWVRLSANCLAIDIIF